MCAICFAKDSPWPQDFSKTDEDQKVFSGQDKSTVDWNDLDESWLDLNKWKESRKFKDNNPLWKLKLRGFKVKEKIGAVIKCVGVCYLQSGLGPKAIEHNSALFEGDEVETKEGSALWIVLINGSIIRLSQSTTLALSEVNLINDSIFVYLRLNDGHIYYESRDDVKFKELNLAESDQLFHPLNELKANREYYSMYEYRKLSRDLRATYEAERNPGALSQYQALNALIDTKESFLNTNKSLTIINTAAYTVKLSKGNLNLFYKANSKSFIGFKHNSYNVISNDLNQSEIKVNIRNNKKFKSIGEGTYEVSKDAFSINKIESIFKPVNLNIKRIPSIHIAREILLRRKFPFLFEKQLDQKEMIVTYGYKTWLKEKMNQRISFLDDTIYERELNTLKLSKRFIKSTDQKIESIFNQDNAIAKAKQDLYNSTVEFKNIRSFSDLDYFVWVMNNAK
jgi:hypothetical protein